MKKILFLFISLLLCTCSAYARRPVNPTNEHYGLGLCNQVGYKCVHVKRGTTWKRLFPNERELDIVQRLNRSDTYLYAGRKLVVPKSFDNVTVQSISPFPLKIKPPHEKLIIVNQNLLALGAYEPDGHLAFWGPVSSGKNYCPDIGRSCLTITGVYYVFNKKDYRCRSNQYPVGRGGSHMPYCMFFYKGYALHGSDSVKGYRDSHGCIRMFTRDAKWLNEHFMDVIGHGNDKGTKIVVERLTTDTKHNV